MPFWHFLHGRIGPPKSYERYFYIFISAMCEMIWKGELKQFSWLGTGIFTWRKVWLSKVLYMKMLSKRCLKTVIFVLESPWKVLDFAQQKVYKPCILWQDVLLVEQGGIYNKSLSIKEISFSQLMISVYNFNLYIKGSCSSKSHFQVPLSALYIPV
jgi:hypothetical protein